MTAFSPREIVSELDRFIVGQNDAKRAVAIALRNRWRRKQLPEPLRDEVTPKNILMIGPTGVGKTEIARRLAKLAGAPFLKVEATKFTEVGYVGRDVDQIMRDLAESAIGLVKEARRKEVRAKAEAAAEERVLDALVGPSSSTTTRESFRKKLRDGALADSPVEVDLADLSGPNPLMDIPGQPGGLGIMNLQDMFSKAFGGRTKRVRMTVAQAYEPLLAEETEKLLDQDQITKEALRLAAEDGIVFIDEIDKVAGMVRTDHILFIASGAFHLSRPSDLIPELQGRFPIRVELSSLSIDDFEAILTSTHASLVRQYQALLATEGVTLEIAPEAVRRLAEIAFEVNERTENIGARRLATVLERLLDEISFDAPNRSGQTVVIDAATVNERLGELSHNEDLSRYIL